MECSRLYCTPFFIFIPPMQISDFRNMKCSYFLRKSIRVCARPTIDILRCRTHREISAHFLNSHPHILAGCRSITERFKFAVKLFNFLNQICQSFGHILEFDSGSFDHCKRCLHCASISKRSAKE